MEGVNEESRKIEKKRRRKKKIIWYKWEVGGKEIIGRDWIRSLFYMVLVIGKLIDDERVMNSE